VCLDFVGRLARYPHVQAIRGQSADAATLFPDGYFDMVYLDADHSYESVKADLKAWLPRVRPGGWIAGHDYTDSWNCGGVIRAVNERLGAPNRVFSDSSWLVQKAF
jgi:hypothetical protein